MEEEKTREFPEPEGSGTKQYLEEMQRIFAVREATYQKRKQEYEQKSRDLQKIQTELGRQYQSLEGQKQEMASAQQKLADQEAAHRKEQEALQREKQDFEQTKKLYEGQQQELLMKSRLELEQLRNERMEAEDLKREYEYQIGQQECGIPPSLPDLSAYVPKLEYEAVKQERDTLVPRKDAVPADTMRRTDAIAGGEPTPDYPVGAERASVETIGGGENLLTEKAAGIQTGIITGARKREGSAAGGGNRTGFSGSNPGRDGYSRRE